MAIAFEREQAARASTTIFSLTAQHVEAARLSLRQEEEVYRRVLNGRYDATAKTLATKALADRRAQLDYIDGQPRGVLVEGLRTIYEEWISEVGTGNNHREAARKVVATHPDVTQLSFVLRKQNWGVDLDKALRATQ